MHEFRVVGADPSSDSIVAIHCNPCSCWQFRLAVNVYLHTLKNYVYILLIRLPQLPSLAEAAAKTMNVDRDRH